MIDAGHEKIRAFAGQSLSSREADRVLENLKDICEKRDLGRLVLAIKKVVPDYSPSQELLERMVAEPEMGGLDRLSAAVGNT